jgi:hypothetical protein
VASKLMIAGLCAAALAVAAPAKFMIIEGGPAQRNVAKAQYRVLKGRWGSTVVSIFAGRKPTGGWVVNVSEVDRSDSGVCTVRYKIAGPGPDAIVTQALTYPSVAIRVTPACRSVGVDPPLR